MKRLQWQAEWGWLAAVLLLLVLGYWWFPGHDRSELDTYSTSAGGKRAFLTVAERLTPPVTRALESFKEEFDANTICILGPARYPDASEWNWLADWVRAGNALVFAARQSDPAVDLASFGVRVVPNQRLIDRRKEKQEKDTKDDSPNSEAKEEAKPAG